MSFKIQYALEDPKACRVQVRFHKDAAREAAAACDRRALAAGFDPEAPLAVETQSESKNWLTQERAYFTPLSLSRALAFSAADLPGEQDLVQNNAARQERMLAQRAEYLERKHPLFAAAGATDELEAPRSPLSFLVGRFDSETSMDVFNAAARQDGWRARQAVARVLGDAAVRELDAHCARIYRGDSVKVSFWTTAGKDPEAALATARELAALRDQPALARWKTQRACSSICLPRALYDRLTAVGAALPDDEARYRFWTQIRDREEARRMARIAAGRDPKPWRDPRGPVSTAPLVQLELRL